MSHLLAAANIVAGTKGIQAPVQRVLAAHLGRHLVAVGKKAKVRAAPEVKRALCKGCHGTLAPGRHATVKLVGKGRKQKRLALTCAQCNTTKSFLAERNPKRARKERARKRKQDKNLETSSIVEKKD